MSRFIVDVPLLSTPPTAEMMTMAIRVYIKDAVKKLPPTITNFIDIDKLSVKFEK